jgi:replication factor A1
MSESGKTKVIDLKPGMENISIDVRVIENLGVRTINTKTGVRTLGEYIVGDDSGRVKLVIWGSKARSLTTGEAITIKNAWVSQYKGEIQLNVGGRSSVEKISDIEVPQPEEIPNETPKMEPSAETSRPPRRGSRGGRGRRRSSW